MVDFLSQDDAGNSAKSARLRHNRRSIVTPPDVCSNIENLVLRLVDPTARRARSELDGSALEFCVSEYWSNGELEYWEKKNRL